MEKKFRYVLINKDSKEVEKIIFISLSEIEQGKLIEDLKKYDVLSRSQFTGQKDKENQEIYENDSIEIKTNKKTYTAKIIFSQDHNGFKAFNEELNAFHNRFDNTCKIMKLYI